jgi:hypothetical protein
MTHVDHRAAATGTNLMVLRCGPSTAALLYPLALIALHQSGRLFVQAADVTGRLWAGVAMCVSAALVYSIPIVSFAVIVQSAHDLLARRLAHLAFAAPPLFTLIGVIFFMLGITNGDYVLWGLLWVGIVAYAASAAPSGSAPTLAPAAIRLAHGFSAAAIVTIFLAWHLLNHMSAVWGLDANKKIMDTLRTWYRSDTVQPFLVALFVFQIASGLRLLWAKIPRVHDVYSSVQTATGAYLAVYIASHLTAVFILGRLFLGIDTTFAWASGAPTGLLLDSWNVRLIPHYSLAVLFVICHLAMGLRVILLGHEVQEKSANRLAWVICAAGLAVSLVITAAQLNVHA